MGQSEVKELSAMGSVTSTGHKIINANRLKVEQHFEPLFMITPPPIYIWYYVNKEQSYIRTLGHVMTKVVRLMFKLAVFV